MKLAVLFAVLGLVATGHALKCYSCKNKKTIKGVTDPTTSNKCADFDKSVKKFELECPADSNKSCLKVTDPDDDENVARGCSSVDKTDCTEPNCYCKEDLCNGSERGWPSAVLLLAALAAALVGGR